MVNYRFATLIGLAGMAVAVPLNINLGAYSPALVVGDGEISFGGGEEVSSLMNALEGAAVNAANGAAPAKGGKKAGAASIASAPGAAAAAASPVSNAASSQQSSQIVSAPATDAASAPNPALEQQAQQIAALQGMGKAIAPRQEADHEGETASAEETEHEEDTPTIAKRDLVSFQAALSFAEKALTKGPKVQLGTGSKEGGSGVGIIVDNNPTTAGKGKERKKRDLGVSQKVKVTTMYVRSGIPASLRNSPELAARDIAIPVGAPTIPRIFSRSDSALDAVNLNVDGDKGLTMTFVETITDADADTEDSAE
ncbi:hypothetical protein PpBr36_01587 [Pyricularia pennisetigena]|uniref:hypothetical protein n=1 Tax=Pyricularia pennisetigena TaxID=1578925 RepID=UPI00114F841C|nr:hypothetical protein PpBr36_01587 [Pyricularia pennisetigena]TLS28911.1 hypothetical protein PpBr36_01587 [Pyricularia pennisetigena]